MNRDYEIYRAPEDEIPVEDKARLDGYLAAKADETELKRMKEKFAEVRASLESASR